MLLVTTDKLRRDVLRIGSAASVATEQNLSAALKSFADHLSGLLYDWNVRGDYLLNRFQMLVKRVAQKLHAVKLTQISTNAHR